MNLKPIIAFVSGLATGAGAAWLIAKKHYEKKMVEEMADERKEFHRILREVTRTDDNSCENWLSSSLQGAEKSENDGGEDHLSETEHDIPDVERYEDLKQYYTAYRDILQRCHYDVAPVEIDEFIKEARTREPRVIPMHEFGNGEFEAISLTYLVDGYLVDETTGNRIPDEEINELIGQNAVTELTEGEDYVYVRNAALRVDIEIINDRTRTYAEFVEEQPEIHEN